MAAITFNPPGSFADLRLDSMRLSTDAGFLFWQRQRKE